MKTLNDNELTDKQLAKVRAIRAAGGTVTAVRDAAGKITFNLSGSPAALRLHLSANMQIEAPGKRGIRS